MKNDIKLILVIKLPFPTTQADMRKYKEELKNTGIHEDYYVLMYTSQEGTTPSFELLHPKDMDENKLTQLYKDIETATKLTNSIPDKDIIDEE